MFFFPLSWAAAAATAMSELEGCAALGVHSQCSTHTLLPSLVGAGDGGLLLVCCWFISGPQLPHNLSHVKGSNTK